MALPPYVFFNWEDLSHANLDQNNLNLNLELRPKRLSSSPVGTVNGCLNMMPRRSLDLDQDQVRDMLNLKIQHYKNSPITKNDFHMMLDVHHFKPEEIEVKVVNDHVVITAKHEDKRDNHGWVSRKFVRRVKLPKDVNVDCLTCRLCSDGLLMIVAPKMLEDETMRTLRIECTGKPFMNKNQEKP